MALGPVRVPSRGFGCAASSRKPGVCGASCILELKCGGKVCVQWGGLALLHHSWPPLSKLLLISSLIYSGHEGLKTRAVATSPSHATVVHRWLVFGMSCIDQRHSASGGACHTLLHSSHHAAGVGQTESNLTHSFCSRLSGPTDIDSYMVHKATLNSVLTRAALRGMRKPGALALVWGGGGGRE